MLPLLPQPESKAHIFELLDAFLRDRKTKKSVRILKEAPLRKTKAMSAIAVIVTI